MRSFHLQVVTPDGAKFDGMVQSLLLRTDDGDVEILAMHADYAASVGVGRARIKNESGEDIYASASGGFITVCRGEVKLIATTFELASEIDLNRAKDAAERAKAALDIAKNERDERIAKAKLARAMNRIDIASLK